MPSNENPRHSCEILQVEHVSGPSCAGGTLPLAAAFAIGCCTGSLGLFPVGGVTLLVPEAPTPLGACVVPDIALGGVRGAAVPAVPGSVMSTSAPGGAATSPLHPQAPSTLMHVSV
jgi:hypothetical protein